MLHCLHLSRIYLVWLVDANINHNKIIKKYMENNNTSMEQSQPINVGKNSELENLKQEILRSVDDSRNKRTLPWGSVLVTIILGLLTILSVAQTAQSITILKKAKSGNFGTASSVTNSGSLQDLPDMVGGC